MHLQVGYEMTYDCPQPTPMVLMLNIHYSHANSLLKPDQLAVEPAVPLKTYRDLYGNWCSRIMASAGRIRISTTAQVECPQTAERTSVQAEQHSLWALPDDTLIYLMGSRYCETDLLMETAWMHFSSAPRGWWRVQAICDFVHKHLRFDYRSARVTRTALEAYHERAGVCRDYAHLAITFCRCMNIPARYCTGYLSDIGQPPTDDPMDFSSWIEVYLSGEWHVFDPRNNAPRTGRILIARGRDAVDVAISTSFGPNTLTSFRVTCFEIPQPPRQELPAANPMLVEHPARLLITRSNGHVPILEGPRNWPMSTQSEFNELKREILE